MTHDDHILDAYRNGERIKEISRLFGVSRQQIYRMAKRAGLPSRYTVDDRRPGRPDVTPDQAVAAYERHGSLRRAAVALGTTAPTIAARLRQASYRIRLNARRQGRLVPLLLLLGLLLTMPAQAQGGDVRPPPAASWWLLPAQSSPPFIVVDAGEAGAQCAESGCVVWAQGGWSRVWVDGRLLAERGRVWLPMTSTESIHGATHSN